MGSLELKKIYIQRQMSVLSNPSSSGADGGQNLGNHCLDCHGTAVTQMCRDAMLVLRDHAS